MNVHALRLELCVEFVDYLRDTIFNHDGRQVDFHIGNGFIDNRLLLSFDGAAFGVCLHALANARLVLVNRLERGNLLNKLVVEFGQFLVLNAVNLASELRLFAR